MSKLGKIEEDNLRRLLQIKTMLKNNKVKHMKELKEFGGSSYLYTNILKFNVIKKINGIYEWLHNDNEVELAKKLTKINREYAMKYKEVVDSKPIQLSMDDTWNNAVLTKSINNQYKKHILYCLEAGIKIPLEWVESYNNLLK